MTDTPENVELADAQYRHRLTRDIHALAAELRDVLLVVEDWISDPATDDVHAILHAALKAADRPLARAVYAARLEVAYLTGEMQRPQPTVRHRDAITDEMVERGAAEARAWGVKSSHGGWSDEEAQRNCARDILEAATRPETTIRETRKP